MVKLDLASLLFSTFPISPHITVVPNFCAFMVFGWQNTNCTINVTLGNFHFFHQLLVSLSIFKFNILLQLFSSILKLIFLGRGNLWCDQGPCLNKVHSICHPFYERSCWSRLLFHNYSKHCCVPKRSQSQLCFQISSPVFHWWQVLVQVSWCFAWSSSIPVSFRRLTHID